MLQRVAKSGKIVARNMLLWLNHYETFASVLTSIITHACFSLTQPANTYLTGLQFSFWNPLWSDWAIEDSIRSMYRITRGANTSRKWEWNFPRLRLTERENITNKRNKHLVLTIIVLNLISITERKVLLFILLIWAPDKSPLTNVGNSQMNKGWSSEMFLFSGLAWHCSRS